MVVLSAACLASCNVAVLGASSDPLATWHVRQAPGSPTDEDFEGVAFGNGRWVIVGDAGSILSSVDGVQWTPEVNPAAPAGLDDVAFGNGVFVAVGHGSKMVLTSPDGRNWTKQAPTVSGCYEIIHDGSRFTILLAGGYLFVSTDGVEWTQPTRVPVNYDVGGLAYGKGVHVEAGYKRTGQPPDLFSSANFSDWLPRDSKLTQNLMNVGFGLGLFIAVGQSGALATSPDGVEWTPRTVPHTGFIWDVVQGAGYLVAAAQWGRLLTSPDGINWTRRETGLDWHLTDIAFGNNTFVAVGWDGQIVQSEPLQTAPPANPLRITDCRHTGNQFTLKFNGQIGASYSVQVSADLEQWAPLTTVQCTETVTSVSDPVGSGPRFYRILAQ